MTTVSPLNLKKELITMEHTKSKGFCHVCLGEIPEWKKNTAIYCGVRCRRKAERAKLTLEYEAQRIERENEKAKFDTRLLTIVENPTEEVLEFWKSAFANPQVIGNRQAVRFTGKVPKWEGEGVSFTQQASDGSWIMMKGRGRHEVAGGFVAEEPRHAGIDLLFNILKGNGSGVALETNVKMTEVGGEGEVENYNEED